METSNKYEGTAIGKIHDEFATIVEQLPAMSELASQKADALLEELEKNNLAKIKRLELLGMQNVQQVKDAKKSRQTMDDAKMGADYGKMLCETLAYMKHTYPQFKVITLRQIEDVCKKYQLLFGNLARFTGFIPEANLKDVENLVENNPFIKEDRHTYEDYDLQTVQPGTIGQVLKIAAPEKDMDTRNATLKDGFMLIDDPVIFYPLRNGFYAIITAWGDEASDPIVVKEKMN